MGEIINMTKQEIKFKINQILPKSIFDFLYSTYQKNISDIVLKNKNKKLQEFKTEQVANFDFQNIKFKINIDPKNGTVDNEIFLQGVYEPSILKIIKNNINTGDVILDVGANIGQHSIFMSFVTGNTGKIISFEPVSSIYAQFKNSIEINNIKNITLHNLACGDMEKEMNINTISSNMGGSSLVFSGDDRKIEKIKVITADSIVKNENKINFIKIDVEGYEYEALLGLKDTIEKHHPKIMLEYSYAGYKSMGTDSAKKILDLLYSFDYDLYDIENNNKKINKSKNNFDYDYFDKNKIVQTNLLCV